jgi:hypothetical protein
MTVFDVTRHMKHAELRTSMVLDEDNSGRQNQWLSYNIASQSGKVKTSLRMVRPQGEVRRPR